MHIAVTNGEETLSGLKAKEVVNIADGSVLGNVSDISLNLEKGCINAIIVPDNTFFSAFSSKRRIIIPWSDIEKIGKDIILVKYKDTPSF